jgi:hypothetical protein
VATLKLVTALPLGSDRSSGSRVRRPVNKTLFMRTSLPDDHTGRPAIDTDGGFDFGGLRRAVRSP